MKSNLIVTAFLALLGTAQFADAASAVPAWQEPGFVMEEVIATAPRVTQWPVYAWQEPSYVMEEVVVTASQSAAIEARRRVRERARYRFALPMRPVIRHLTRELVRRAGQFDIELDSLAVAP